MRVKAIASFYQIQRVLLGDRFDFSVVCQIAFFLGISPKTLTAPNLTNEQSTSLINAFCQTVEDAGYQSGIYASASVYQRNINTNKLNENAVIWVAQYANEITYSDNFDIWQYSKTGTLDGIGSKYVDLNYWYVKE